jgi:hypothetical protein
MVNALGAEHAPSAVRKGLALPFFALSRSLGNTLAEMDEGIGAWGLPIAAGRALGDFGVALRANENLTPNGAQLVLANHPGAYDALGLISAIGRRDLLILAADRSFLRALPGLSEHLVFVGQGTAERAAALKRAVVRLARGGVVLHFPAGAIEPDADFEPLAARWLGRWQPGVAALLRACARSGGRVAVAGVRGVHSPRAKLFVLNRLAERRGITTISPLVQLAGRLRDVAMRVRLSDAGAGSELLDVEAERRLRSRLLEAIRQA